MPNSTVSKSSVKLGLRDVILAEILLQEVVFQSTPNSAVGNLIIIFAVERMLLEGTKLRFSWPIPPADESSSCTMTLWSIPDSNTMEGAVPLSRISAFNPLVVRVKGPVAVPDRSPLKNAGGV